MSETLTLWDRVLKAIEPLVTRHAFYSWFRPSEGAELDGKFHVITPFQETAEWLEEYFRPVFLEALAKIGRGDLILEISVRKFEPRATPRIPTKPVMPSKDSAME